MSKKDVKETTDKNPPGAQTEGMGGAPIPSTGELAVSHLLAIWWAITEHTKSNKCLCHFKSRNGNRDDAIFVPAFNCDQGIQLADEYRLAAERYEQTARGGPAQPTKE